MIVKECLLFYFVSLLKFLLAVKINKFNNNSAKECGLSQISNNRVPRIIGGKDTIDGQWPWQVAIIQIDPTKNEILSQFHCGGTLISQRWIVTAAHCFIDPFLKFALPPSFWRVSVDEIKPTELDFKEYHRVSKIILHKDFNQISWINDIALVKMHTTQDKRIFTPICLPLNNINLYKNNYNCTVTGWGQTSSDGSNPLKLQMLEVSLLSNKICQKVYKITNKFSKNMMCAGQLASHSGPCVGDSGGPIQCLGDDGKWIILGIISWGLGCDNYPAVYIKISSYLEWIRDNTELEI